MASEGLSLGDFSWDGFSWEELSSVVCWSSSAALVGLEADCEVLSAVCVVTVESVVGGVSVDPLLVVADGGKTTISGPSVSPEVRCIVVLTWLVLAKIDGASGSFSRILRLFRPLSFMARFHAVNL